MHTMLSAKWNPSSDWAFSSFILILIIHVTKIPWFEVTRFRVVYDNYHFSNTSLKTPCTQVNMDIVLKAYWSEKH